MVKYNYNKAGAIWDRLIDITYDMPDYLDFSQRQIERRLFLKALTRFDLKWIDVYLEYIANYIDDFRDTHIDNHEKELKQIALDIVSFTN